MTIARSVADVLRNHVVLEYESIDRMYLNVYVPHLQTVGSVVGYLRVHHDLRFASTSAVAPMTDAFVRNVEEFVAAEDVDLVGFQKNQRKDEVTQKRIRKFKKNEGVLYVGKAQEKARVMRAERRHSSRTGATYPWIVESTAMVNHYYFYCVDEDFGPFFLKFCSYFPYNAKLCINGHEYLKRQLAKWGLRSSPSTTASNLVQTPLCCSGWPMGLRRRRSSACCASGCADCHIRSPHAIAPPAIVISCRSCRRSSPSPRCSISRRPAGSFSKR